MFKKHDVNIPFSNKINSKVFQSTEMWIKTKNLKIVKYKDSCGMPKLLKHTLSLICMCGIYIHQN